MNKIHYGDTVGYQHIAKEQKTGFQQMLAGIVNYLLGVTHSQDRLSSFDDLKVIHQINRTKIIMHENFHTTISCVYGAFRHYKC